MAHESIVKAVTQSVREATKCPPTVGPFVAAVAQSEVPFLEWLVDNAELADLRLMSKELLLAIDASCRDLDWDKLARLYLDWIATLEVACEDRDKSLLRAREELQRGEGKEGGPY